MTATYQGSMSIAGALSKVATENQKIGEALQALDGAVATQATALGVTAAVCSQNDLDLRVGEIEAGVGAQLQAQIDGGLTVQAQLAAVLDANAWLGDIEANIQASLDLLGTLDAPTFLADQKLAIDAGIASSTAALATLDASLDGVLDIDLQLDACWSAVLAAVVALNAARDAANSALVAYASLFSAMMAEGVYVTHFSGNLADLGADVDAAMTSSPVSSTSATTAMVMVVEDSNTTTLANFKDLFGIS